MDIIWNKEELVRIKDFLKRNNLEFSDDENYDIVISDKYKHATIFLPTYLYHCHGLNDLVWYQDKGEIYSVLKKTIPIRYIVKNNKDNPICNGLLTALVNINPNDATEIFVIFKELLSQYVRVSYNMAEHITRNLNDPKLIKEIIEEIKNNPLDTKEELYIKNYMNKLFTYTNGIFDSDIFRPIIDECNNNIRTDLIYNIYRKCVVYAKQNKIVKDSTYSSYLSDLFAKLRKNNIITNKYSKGIRGGNHV